MQHNWNKYENRVHIGLGVEVAEYYFDFGCFIDVYFPSTVDVIKIR